MLNICTTSARRQGWQTPHDLAVPQTTTGTRSYITSSRYRSMVTDYIRPTDKTYALLGNPKTSLQQGVNETITWLRTQPGYSPT